MDDWKASVYKKQDNGLVENWHVVRRKILERDRYQCFRCESRDRRLLTVHHIIPRIEHGSENSENLITLCGDCHNFVEISNFRSLVEIEASAENIPNKERKERTIKKQKHLDENGDENFVRPDWHKYVYGGKRRSDKQ